MRDDLGIRMKNNYEVRNRTYLTRRTPVAIRIDGKAFHTFTKGLKKPFDELFMSCMINTMWDLCTNIQGCVFGYTQSDEITLILQDYATLTTDAWFDYQVQKMCSVSASMATLTFIRSFVAGTDYYINVDSVLETENEENQKYIEVLKRKCKASAYFDSRCFNIPKEEVCNLIYWRQLDATRNSINSCAQSMFPHKQLQNLNCNQVQDLMFKEKGFNWDSLPVFKKRGTACFKNDNGEWYIDYEMPILRGEDRNYVDKHIYIGD